MGQDCVAETISATIIEGVFIIRRPVFADERGFFHEIYRQNELDKKIGISFRPVQFNQSRSQKGVLRGIHVANYKKLVYSPHKIQQVVVDLRKDSITFKQHISIILGKDDKCAVIIPPFCGNAFQSLERACDYYYLAEDYWTAEKEFQVAFNDPELNINWRINPPALLSERDSHQPTVAQLLEQGIIR